MPRRKVNIYTVDEGNIYKINTKGVKCSFDKEHDCYYISLKDLKKRCLDITILIYNTFIEINAEKYYYANLMVKKHKGSIGLYLVYERSKVSQFTETGNIEDCIDGIEFFDVGNLSDWIIRYFKLRWIHYGWKLLKDKFYIQNQYILKDGQKIPFWHIAIENNCHCFDIEVSYFLDLNN